MSGWKVSSLVLFSTVFTFKFLSSCFLFLYSFLKHLVLGHPVGLFPLNFNSLHNILVLSILSTLANHCHYFSCKIMNKIFYSKLFFIDFISNSIQTCFCLVSFKIWYPFIRVHISALNIRITLRASAHEQFFCRSGKTTAIAYSFSLFTRMVK